MGTSRTRGVTALVFGLALGVIGIDTQTGASRMVFGTLELLDGISFTVVLVSLFAIGETLYVASRHSSMPPVINPLSGGAWMSKEDWKRSWKPWLRGSIIGFPIGSLPAGGTEVPTFISYSLERRLCRYPDEFGKGAIEGVAGPEAANNAAAAGILVPLLTLGLPSTATAAVLLAAFQNYGLQPGPLLFATNPTLVWALIASLYIGNAILLVLNLPLVGLWVRLLLIPRPYIYAGIVVFALVGVWGLSTSWMDLLLMFLIGLAGYLARVYDFPIAPALIGLILGPQAEIQLRRALAVSQGDWNVLVTSPISLSFLVLTVLVLVLPLLWGIVQRLRQPEASA
jgi:putative tricarboxylic transport membrane protein